MKVRSCLTVALLLTATNLPAADEAPTTPRAKNGLEGIWSVTSMQDNGQMLPASRVSLLRFVFSKERLTIRRLDEVIAETSYQADPAQEPAAIDLIYGDQPTSGIFRIDGDQLTICLGRSVNERPKRFASDADSASRVLIILQRGDLTPEGRPLFVIRADGTGLARLARLPKDMMTGSPDWSPDGTHIACDAWRLIHKETYVAAHILVIRADGTDVRDLGLGAMPSWSPDSRRIVFCRYRPNRGVWIMDADGSHRTLIDSAGWGCDWSPTGSEIVYSAYRPFPNLIVRDVDSGEQRALFEKKKYRMIYYNMSWSADAKFIAFKGVRSDGTEEIAVVSALGERHGFWVVLGKPRGGQPQVGWGAQVAGRKKQAGDESASSFPRILSLAHMVAWDGTAKSILVSMRTKTDQASQLYVVDPKGEQPPLRVPGQPADRKNFGMAWSPDAKRIVFASQMMKPKPKPAGKSGGQRRR
ncbi:MAG: TIGR03067 domain-containing protein [Planctomycetes bacterium]|nr:TIGR03067 domain-containing protein [Planctomycetota bacterium]